MMASMVLQPAKWIPALGIPGCLLLSLTILLIMAALMLRLWKEEERKGMVPMFIILAAGAVLPCILYGAGVVELAAAAKAYRDVIGILALLCLACIAWSVPGKEGE